MDSLRNNIGRRLEVVGVEILLHHHRPGLVHPQETLPWAKRAVEAVRKQQRLNFCLHHLPVISWDELSNVSGIVLFHSHCVLPVHPLCIPGVGQLHPFIPCQHHALHLCPAERASPQSAPAPLKALHAHTGVLRVPM